jgi:hypothetical protein
LVTGTTTAPQRVTARSAVTSALRRAQWALVDAAFDKKELAQVQSCLSASQAWACMEAIMHAKAADRFLAVRLAPDRGGGIELRAQLVGPTSVPATKDGYCAAPCSESALAQAASDLVDALLTDVAALTGNTFIEVLSDPPGAAVSIDAQALGPAGKKFPSRPGRHHVLITLSGYRDEDLLVDLVDGETKTLRPTLAPLHARPTPASTPGRRWQPWALLGGGAGVAGGGLLASYVLGRRAEPDATTDEPLRARYHSTPALIVAGAGGAIAVTGLVWLVVRRVRADAGDKSATPALSISPTGAQAAWTFTF